MLGVFAELENNLRRERQMAGIAAAKARGVYRGRPSSINPTAVQALRSEGLGPAEIARRLKISRASVYRLTNVQPVASPSPATLARGDMRCEVAGRTDHRVRPARPLRSLHAAWRKNTAHCRMRSADPSLDRTKEFISDLASVALDPKATESDFDRAFAHLRRKFAYGDPEPAPEPVDADIDPETF
jgi:hypothetical protein